MQDIMRTTYDQRRALAQLDADDLVAHQLQRLNHLIHTILPHNRFYAEKFSSIRLPLDRLEDLHDLPYTFKDELVSDRKEGDFATNLTFPVEQYVRFHRTSGTRGRPMVVLDTQDDWQWWVDTWQYVYDAADVGPEDRLAMCFSFGPFIGFWSAHDAAVARGALVAPTGGMNTIGRLELIRNLRATTICCTPSYALHMVEVAHENQIEVGDLEVRRIIVAGEPGGSIPALRKRIESAWNARVIDHSGASEIGPWGFADAEGRGLHVIESEFIAEFRSVETGEVANEGELSELVLTNLGRSGSPVFRYRTGDLVKPTWQTNGDCRFVLLEGGVLGRVDDMMIIRGVNVFPSSIEQILRSFPEIVEYRLTAQKRGAMDELTIEIEDRLNDPRRVAEELKLRIGLRIDVSCVPLGSLPRFEAKGKRFVDQR